IPIYPQGCGVGASGDDCSDGFAHRVDRVEIAGNFCDGAGIGASGSTHCLSIDRMENVLVRNNLIYLWTGYANGIRIGGQAQARDDNSCGNAAWPTAGNYGVFGNSFAWTSGTPADAEDPLIVLSGRTARVANNLLYSSSGS